MRVSKAFVAGVLAITSVSSTPAVGAYGFCIEPKAPSLLFLRKPSKPICISGCSEWEISNYKSDVKRYFSSLQEYSDDVDRYYKKAGEYVECMAKL
jgi:hypothetical protein